MEVGVGVAGEPASWVARVQLLAKRLLMLGSCSCHHAGCGGARSRGVVPSGTFVMSSGRVVNDLSVRGVWLALAAHFALGEEPLEGQLQYLRSTARAVFGADEVAADEH